MLVLKRDMWKGGGRAPLTVTNSELPQKSLICNFSRRSPENSDSLYLNMLVIPKSPKRTITKKIDFCNYYENCHEDKNKWEVD